MANGCAIHRLAISSRSAEPPDGFRQTQFTIIRVRSVCRGWYRWDGVPVLGNDYQALAARFVHSPAGFASSPTSTTGTTGTTSTPGLRMISRTEFSFESRDRDLRIESAIIDSRLAQVCGTGRWSNPIHYHSSEISWSRVVPVGQGTGARSGDQPSTSDLATRAQSESVHECSVDSRNLMLLLETAVSKLKNVCAIAISLPLTTTAVILRLRSWRGIST